MNNLYDTIEIRDESTQETVLNSLDANCSVSRSASAPEYTLTLLAGFESFTLDQNGSSYLRAVTEMFMYIYIFIHLLPKLRIAIMRVIKFEAARIIIKQFNVSLTHMYSQGDQK